MDPANRLFYEGFGALVRRHRRARDLTQEQLASRLDITRGALANIETGRQNVLLHQVYRFATALKLEVQELLPTPHAAREEAVKDLPMPKNLTADQTTQVAQVFSEAASRRSDTKRKPG